jgi:Cu/Ag efflux protein CusF
MTRKSGVLAGLFAAAVLWTAAAAEQAKPVCDPPQSDAVTPARAEGEVVKVDTASGKVTIREPDGKSHEYLASQRTLREFKEGDRVKVTLTQPRGC